MSHSSLRFQLCQFAEHTEIEYLSNNPGNSIKNRKINTIKDDYYIWLSTILARSPNISYLSLDTNFIQNCLYSNFIKDKPDLVPSRNSAIRILIPRLLILEIEHKYNRQNTQNKQNDKQKKDKRIEFNNMGEVLRLIEDGATITPKLDYSLIREFSSIAGGHFTDSFIRMETSNYVNGISEEPPIFLTSDLMNAMTALAEGMDCLYFHVINKVRKNINISLLIYHSAIQYDECLYNLVEQNTTRKFKSLAMWNGKTPYEWKKNIMKVTENS